MRKTECRQNSTTILHVSPIVTSPMTLTDVSLKGGEEQRCVTLNRVIITRDSHRWTNILSRTGLRNEEGDYERVTKNWSERGKRRKTRCRSEAGGHGFRKFATQVGRKIRNEWRNDTMQRVADGRQNRRHPPSSSVAATRLPQNPPDWNHSPPFAKEKKGCGGGNIKKEGTVKGGGRQKGRSRSSF